MAENGQEHENNKEFTVILKWIPNTGQLSVAVGDEPIELVTLLNLLTAAQREVEADWRVQKGIAAQMALKQQVEDHARTQALMERVIRKPS